MPEDEFKGWEDCLDWLQNDQRTLERVDILIKAMS